MKKIQVNRKEFRVTKHALTYKKKAGKYIESKPIKIGKALLKEESC